MKWFLDLDVTVQVAIIGGVAAVCVPVINGLFNVINSKSKTKNTTSNESLTTINQTTSGSNNTLIGIQNNRNDEVK